MNRKLKAIIKLWKSPEGEMLIGFFNNGGLDRAFHTKDSIQILEHMNWLQRGGWIIDIDLYAAEKLKEV